MLKYWDLILKEAPLSGYELHGDWSNDHHIGKALNVDLENFEGIPNSFVSKIDRELVQHPDTKARLEKAFTHLEQNIYILFLNSPAGLEIASRYLDIGEINNAGHQLGELLGSSGDAAQKIAEDDPKSIVFILTHNEGGNIRHRLTPWMIAHRLSHAFPPMELINPIADLASRHYGVNSNDKEDVSVLLDFMTTKSARTKSINLINAKYVEIKCELITQYLIKGSVKLRKPDGVTSEEGVYYSLIPDTHIDDAIRDAEREINRRIASKLSSMVRKIYVC